MNHPMTVMLHDSVEMPMHGLGVFKSTPGAETADAVRHAITTGYRLIDTAMIYRNEESVGEGIASSGLPRDEIFVTTKLWNSDQGYESALRALDTSLQKLGLDYVDLYLIHWPLNSKNSESWRALEHLQAEGRTRAIGVSNFHKHHLDALMADANVAPSVNQIELHPNLQQVPTRKADDELGIVTQAWSPLKQARILSDPALLGIAAKHDKTAAQVVLRWQLDIGIATIPKSVTPSRIDENGDVFDFHLDGADLAAMALLDNGDRIGPDPDDYPEGFGDD